MAASAAGDAGAAAATGAARKVASILQSAEFARTELNAARRAMRLSAKPQPEVHIMGEICGGTGFGDGKAVACKWALEAGERWELLEGARGGQTQTDSGEGGSDTVVWAHPVDAHYVAGALQGWPRLLFQVWRLDDVGRLEVEGYGFVHVPTAPGVHELSCPTWRPVGTPAQELAAFFVGGAPSLTTTSVLFTAATERYRLVTAPSGTIHVRLEVLHRNMDLYNVET